MYSFYVLELPTMCYDKMWWNMVTCCLYLHTWYIWWGRKQNFLKQSTIVSHDLAQRPEPLLYSHSSNTIQQRMEYYLNEKHSVLLKIVYLLDHCWRGNKDLLFHVTINKKWNIWKYFLKITKPTFLDKYKYDNQKLNVGKSGKSESDNPTSHT